jgi:hypothetical protein
MTTKEFVEKLKRDAKENNTEIFAKIRAAGKDPEAIYAVAKEVGVTDSFENFKAEMRNWYESMSQELSEEDLANIAGGDVGVMEYIYAGCTVAFGAGVAGLF